MSRPQAGSHQRSVRRGLWAEPVTRLRVVPITLREANAYIAENHRHHGETRGCILVAAVADEHDEVRGVAIAGRPVARLLQDGYTAEVTRLCTDGAPNACSMLYRALWRACRAVGYLRLVTYTLPQEGGTSLRAAGFELVGEAGGGTWNRANGRPRVDLHPLQEKLRWELNAPLDKHPSQVTDSPAVEAGEVAKAESFGSPEPPRSSPDVQSVA